MKGEGIGRMSIAGEKIMEYKYVQNFCWKVQMEDTSLEILE
jgi:hypothetical protein